MITIDFTEEVISVEPDSDIDILATIQTGSPDGCVFEENGWGKAIEAELANTSGLLGANLFRVSARYLKEIGKYEITSTTRTGKTRKVVIELEVFSDHLRLTVLRDSTRFFWIYENLDPERIGAAEGSTIYFDSYYTFEVGDPAQAPVPAADEGQRPQTAWQHLDNDDYEEGS
jgi:hypothetical protein